jgi:uncharacterized protein (DUF934 family)
MPKLIKSTGEGMAWVDDRFTDVADDEAAPRGDVIVSLKRFLSEGEALQADGREVGVRIEAGEAVEDLAYDLPTIPVVALVFPKFRDGRAFSAAALLRERYGYKGEVRAVGDVLREQAMFMVRTGFDAFAPADASTPELWAAAAGRFRHVYQRAADDRAPAFEQRAAARVKTHAV